MCTTCGCSTGSAPTLTNLRTGESMALHEHEHEHEHGHIHAHDHDHHAHDHDHHAHDHDHHAHDHHTHSHAPAHVHPPAHPHRHSSGQAARTPATLVALERDLLAKNDQLAARNRGWFAGRDIVALNLVSSPGSGKTTLLERALRDLRGEQAMSVIEGDQETVLDAQRIRATGTDVVQINTGTGCHLEAEMLARGLEQLDPAPHSLVWIENVGNLVCPALFDLGERCKIVIMSVTEGADKPLKYPHMFRASELMLLNKIDLLPHVSFDVAECIAGARQVNPALQVIQISATRGDGLTEFYAWLRGLRAPRDRSPLAGRGR